MRTHYDNLKVSKDAPVEVIQAAYRTLAKKYHPDINKNNPEAVRIMQIINASYEVLIDPLKRKEHDSWIIKETWREKAEATIARESETNINVNTPIERTTGRKPKSLMTIIGVIFSRLFFMFRTIAGLCVIGIIAYAIINNINEGDASLNKTDTGRNSSPLKPERVNNNNGICDSSVQQLLWPTIPTVLSEKDRRNGLSSLRLDNTQNNEGLRVRLTLDNAYIKTDFVREVFVPAGSQITLEQVPSGIYRVKTQNVKNGCVQISEPINVIERQTSTGTEYSDNSLTFYSVINGNTHFLSLAASQF
ncbi:J domain-containing protein [Raoultella planticola]|uniref:J domain-containing protein n=1 Tax=Raoultella planticola TaxID=575 RepID=UPI0009077A90|nr:J domain-containing protein [Raoultella planticola]